MKKPKSELEELKDLQKESRKLQQKQETSVEAQAEAEAIEMPPAGKEDGGEPLAEQGEFLEGLAPQVENIMTELEEAATEHPALALLAAFGIGIFVGQLLSRR